MSYTVEAEMDLSEDGGTCRIVIATSDKKALTPQEIMDSVSDLVLHYYGLPQPDPAQLDS